MLHQLHWQPPIFLSFVDIEVKVVHQEDMDKFVAVFTAMCGYQQAKFWGFLVFGLQMECSISYGMAKAN